MKLQKPVIMLLMLIPLLIAFYALKNQSQEKPEGIIAAKIGNRTYNLEVSDNDEERAQGLSGRKSMDERSGMLFIFQDKEIRSFWMKEMYFPLDFIWLDDDLIVDLSENIPPPKNGDTSNLEIITPLKPVDKVIELNSGQISKMNLKIGDKIEFID